MPPLEEEGEDDQEMIEPGREDLLGLSIAPLTEALRSKFGIGAEIQGVIITDVEPNSPAARRTSTRAMPSSKSPNKR